MATEGGPSTPASDRERLIALLEANHRFPGEYYLSVITFATDGVFASLKAVVEEGLVSPLDAQACETRASGGGKYQSHRFRVPVESAEAVLGLYERVRTVAGVITVL